MPRTIRQLDNQQSDEIDLLPKHSFVCPIVGNIASGKTTIMLNLLTNEDFFKKKYHRIIFISPTCALDEKTLELLKMPDLCISNQKLQDLYDDRCLTYDENHVRTKFNKYHGIQPDDVHDTYYPEILSNLFEHQLRIIKEFGKPASDRCLVIIDDSITAGCYKKSHSDTFARFITALRHVNTSVFHMTQLFKSIPKIIRTQSTAGIFAGDLNEVELKDVSEIFSCGYPFHKWCEIFSVVTSKPYQPIVFNLRNPRGYRIQRGFEEFVG
jgi:hypothetical protein